MGKTISEALKSTTEIFWKKDIESPRVEAELLVGHILNLKRTHLYLNSQRVLSSEEEKRLNSLVEERLRGKPLQYVIGETEFYGLKFKVDSRALIPRPETEILVSKVLEYFKKEKRESDYLKIIDIGTGAGNITIALAFHLKNCVVYATDISPDALSLAQENAEINKINDRIEFLCGDLFAPLINKGLEGKINAVVSNPPYVQAEEKEILPKEVRDFEPEVALFAEEGLYNKIIDQSALFLKKGRGILALETGYGQAQKVNNIIATKGEFTSIEIFKDLAGIERVVFAIKR
ncbi:MAG TPA: peptide chain release factor N(5)-glutamine methyltransferase [Terriglobales bacterium]|nr:peptide chain release factor N(5)-glutamine methyltransferase [Terriglobales bacterium]